MNEFFFLLERQVFMKHVHKQARTSAIPRAPRIFCKTRLNSNIVSLSIFLGTIGTAHEAVAMPGYDATVRSWCAAAGRPAPSFTPDVCSTCHAGSNYGASTSKKTAYQNLRASQSAANLNAFCAAAATPKPTPKPTPAPSSTNHAPSLTLQPSGNQSVSEGHTLSINVTASDPDGNPVTLSAAPSPLPGGATFSATGGNGTFTWPTAPGDVGTYSVTFTAKDKPADVAKSLLTSQTVSISVVPASSSANHAPVLDVIPSPQTATVGQALQFTVTASDPDDDNLKYLAANLPAGASLVENGMVDGKWKATFSWTPTADQTGQSYTASITVRDDFSSPSQASQDVNFSVLPAAADVSVKKVQVGQARWVSNRSRLIVKGKAKFFKGHRRSASPMSVTIYDADSSQALGVVPLRRNGSWKFAGTLVESAVPCTVRADLNGSGAIRNVKRAPGACSNDVMPTTKPSSRSSSEHTDGDD
ncbi:MAG: hypothetical protein H6R26_1821 [Proteobacteria bacterium]|nr:hypothetical protein [Pseudomonadota bacterium]